MVNWKTEREQLTG